MPIFRIHHITKYTYNRPVKESMNEIKIFPFNCAEQEILQHDITITDNPDVQTFTDYWGNKTGVFNLLVPHNVMSIESKLILRTTAPQQVHVNFQSGFEELANEMKFELRLIELSMTDTISAQSGIDAIAAKIAPPGTSVATVVQNCSEYIFKQFKYIKGITNIETTVNQILEHQSGVCQDFAHLMLQVLRTLHIPSRYVSGYICPNKNGMRGEGATHAWVEAWIPDYGWAGIDPTNNTWVTNNHVKLAVGRHFNDCTPVKGTFKGLAKQTLSVYVSIGYEGGEIFEEITDVQTQSQANAKPTNEILIEDLGSQQQQQQQ